MTRRVVTLKVAFENQVGKAKSKYTYEPLPPKSKEMTPFNIHRAWKNEEGCIGRL